MPHSKQETAKSSISVETGGETLAEATKQDLSIIPEEIAKFASSATKWWDTKGPYAVLHRMQPVRSEFVRRVLETENPNRHPESLPLYKMRILDVGCGGGLLSESLAKLGATVLGVDATGENIKVATHHAKQGGLHVSQLSPRSDDVDQTDIKCGSVEYRNITAESLLDEGQEFDAVVSLEVIEHVADAKAFAQTLASLVKKSGIVIMSTMNRTIPSWFLSIVCAEFILGWIEKGTHHYHMYVTPEEMESYLASAGCDKVRVSGMAYNLFNNTWYLLNKDWKINRMMNYIMAVRKSV